MVTDCAIAMTIPYPRLENEQKQSRKEKKAAAAAAAAGLQKSKSLHAVTCSPTGRGSSLQLGKKNVTSHSSILITRLEYSTVKLSSDLDGQRLRPQQCPFARSHLRSSSNVDTAHLQLIEGSESKADQQTTESQQQTFWLKQHEICCWTFSEHFAKLRIASCSEMNSGSLSMPPGMQAAELRIRRSQTVRGVPTRTAQSASDSSTPIASAAPRDRRLLPRVATLSPRRALSPGPIAKDGGGRSIRSIASVFPGPDTLSAAASAAVFPRPTSPTLPLHAYLKRRGSVGSIGFNSHAGAGFTSPRHTAIMMSPLPTAAPGARLGAAPVPVPPAAAAVEGTFKSRNSDANRTARNTSSTTNSASASSIVPVPDEPRVLESSASPSSYAMTPLPSDPTRLPAAVRLAAIGGTVSRQNVRVFCRFRPPFSDADSTSQPFDIDTVQHAVSVISSGQAQDASGPQTFTFDGVFDERNTQEDVYTDVASPMVADLMGGYNCTIFACMTFQLLCLSSFMFSFAFAFFSL